MGPKRKYEEDQSVWALKRQDGEALYRRDVQYQFLQELFDDERFSFINPDGSDTRLHFSQLYLDCLSNSSKVTRNLRDRLVENKEFAMNYAKLSLLINVGRINTTLAFYPEMKTTLRSYHPVPCLQRDDYSRKNMQDAPRIKGQLKACALKTEVTNPPDSLREIANRVELGHRPPTCVVTLIFQFIQESTWITEKYFPPGFTFQDIFYPTKTVVSSTGQSHEKSIPSTVKVYAFLWLIHRFLESDEVYNDFKTKERVRDTFPFFTQDMSAENIDPEDELQFANDMKVVRREFLKKHKMDEKRDGVGMGDEGSETASKRPKDDEIPAVLDEAMSNIRTIDLPTGSVLHDPLQDNPGWLDVYEDEMQTHPSSLLQQAWSRVKRDTGRYRDPCYDSEEEDDWTASELYPRLVPMTFRKGETTGLVQYTGTANRMSSKAQSAAMDPTNRRGRSGKISLVDMDDERDREAIRRQISSRLFVA